MSKAELKSSPPRPATQDPAAAPTPARAPAPEGDLAGTGMFIKGRVTDRQRRAFDLKNGGRRWNIQVSVLTAEGLVKVERWADAPMPSDVPATGTMVTLPFRVIYYHTRSGTGVRLVWGENSNAAEKF